MKRIPKGEVKLSTLIIFLLVLFSIGTMLIYKWWESRRAAQEEVESSDAAGTKGKISIGVDSWIGYYPLCSTRMKKEIRNNGYLLDCMDDEADIPSRMQKLKDKEIQFACATVDSYILSGFEKQYPGIVVAVIDESFGGDCILGYEDKVPNLEALKNRNDFKIAYPLNTSSHHLVKAASTHFGISSLSNPKLRVETKGSKEALAELQKKKVDLAVLWEPDVSKALKIPGVIKLLGTEKTRRMIVDVLLVNRDYAQENPEVVELVLNCYFRVLKYYRDNPEELQKEILPRAENSPELAAQMVKGVRWTSLTENCEEWLPVKKGTTTEDGLVSTIESAVSIMTDHNDFKSNPLPGKDPYRILNRTFIERVFQKANRSGFTVPVAIKGIAPITFQNLSAEGWATLREVGAMKVDPIKFKSGTSELVLEGKEELDLIMKDKVTHYPAFRILIKGYSDTAGDPEVNKVLSQERAEAVAKYLEITHGIPPPRMRAVGYGGTAPLARLPGESDRAYRFRLPRVEIVLLSEVY